LKPLIYFYRKITERIVDGMSPEDYKRAAAATPWLVLFVDSHPAHIYDAEVLANMRYHKVCNLD
jgi:hypothetical protein